MFYLKVPIHVSGISGRNRFGYNKSERPTITWLGSESQGRGHLEKTCKTLIQGEEVLLPAWSFFHVEVLLGSVQPVQYLAVEGRHLRDVQQTDSLC